MHRPQLASVLPTHPTLEHPDGRPVVALGLNRHGLPIWPVRGGAPDDDDTDSGEDDEDDQTDDNGGDDDQDKTLGPAGEKALQAEKTKRRAAQAQLREWKALGKTPAQMQALLAGAKPDDDKTLDRDAIRAELKRETDAEVLHDRMLDKIEAKAHGFADPDDAAALLLRSTDINDYLDDDGKIDVEAIEEGLAALLEKKPYLAAQGGGKRFKGGGDGGRRKDEPVKAKTLQEAVTARMKPGGSTR